VTHRRRPDKPACVKWQWAGAVVAALILCLTPVAGHAQTTEPSAIPAKQAFGAVLTPAQLAARAIGSYARGCLAGGQMLPVDGPAWQAMRLSRNRNWGHPDLIDYIERLARDAQAQDNWPGLMVGDMAQPRGGPMLTGHASHQIGLDVDIWLKPMPSRRLSQREREEISAVSMLAPGGLSVNRDVWTPGHVRLLRRAASYPQVARIFVHPAIKKALCEAAGSDREWLRRIRPWWGHHYHFHVRLHCPAGMVGCVDQEPPPPGDGCGEQLDEWYAMLSAPPKPAVPQKLRPELTLADLPSTCTDVLSYDLPQSGAPIGPVPVPVRKAVAPPR
jgi:penicillin-insensitive murein endopeptidase